MANADLRAAVTRWLVLAAAALPALHVVWHGLAHALGVPCP